MHISGISDIGIYSVACVNALTSCIIFTQEFVLARRTAGLNNAPPCLWSSSPPLELKKAPAEALSANAGFVSFGNY